MPRLALPGVDVTSPEGRKSLWVAYSIPHQRAVAAVRESLPPDHLAELSILRAPPAFAFDGARPGDIIKMKCWPRCPRCLAVARVFRASPGNGKAIKRKSIRLLQCGCAESVSKPD